MKAIAEFNVHKDWQPGQCNLCYAHYYEWNGGDYYCCCPFGWKYDECKAKIKKVKKNGLRNKKVKKGDDKNEQ